MSSTTTATTVPFRNPAETPVMWRSVALTKPAPPTTVLISLPARLGAVTACQRARVA